VPHSTSDLPACLLTYTFSTAPSPIQASTAHAESNALLNVWVSSTGNTIYCNQLIIAVPIGSAKTDLTENPPTLTPNVTTWVVSSAIIVTAQELGLTGNANYAIFYCDCTAPQHYLINYNLVFSMNVQPVNQHTGPFQYIVNENSGQTSNPKQFEQRRTIFTITKEAAQFYLTNFIAVSATTTTGIEPRSLFSNGEPLRFIWESNGTNFSLYVNNQPKPLYSGQDTAYTLSSGITANATFTLQGTMASHVDDEAQPSLDATLDVTISNPDITATSITTETLTVVDTGTLIGDATLDSAKVDGTLSVTGTSTLNGSNTTLAALTTTGNSNLLGQATLGNARVNGTLNATGTTTLGRTTITGLTIQNALSMLNPRAINTGTYTASSDGLVIGKISGPSDAWKRSLVWISGYIIGSIAAQATGGNVESWKDGNKNFTMQGNAKSFMLPVSQGLTWTISAQIATGNEENPSINFYWIPFGKNATLEKLPDIEIPTAERPQAELLVRPSRKERVAAVVDALVAMPGIRSTPDIQRRLTLVLQQLADHLPSSPSIS
jgi:hypothetical protein